MSFSPIRVSTLRGDQKIEFDIFFKVGEKFLLLLREGDSFEGARLKRLREKKLKRLFIREDDEQKYRQYVERNIDMAYDSQSPKPLEQRAEIIQGDQQARTEELLERPEDPETYQNTKKGVEKFFSLLAKESDLAQHILAQENVDQSLAHHGVNVATWVQVLLGAHPNFLPSDQHSLVGLGALLHDIEHFHSGLAVQKPLKSFLSEELEIYRRHPALGAARVKDLQHFDSLVLSIIEQHEETLDGKGFPQGLVENQIIPAAQIVSLCNYADRLVTFEKMPLMEVPKILMVDGVGKYPLPLLQTLAQKLKNQKSSSQ